MCYNKETSTTQTHVLIVDDTESIRHSLSLFLKLENIESEAAQDAEEALFKALAAAARSKPFTVVLLDLYMPGAATDSLVAKLRQFTPTKRPKIILFSASTGLAEEAKRLGVDHYLAKPFALEDLLAKIRSKAATATRAKQIEHALE